ncbi:MAG: nucleoside monophosphate kinase [Planctomycetota bacterium]
MTASPQKTDHVDLEIKDAQVIFETVWESLEEEIGHEHLRFPKELILLGGAPGSGKGTHTRFIMQARGLTCPPIVVSQLLTTPEAQRIKDSGQMVGDTEVIGILLRELLKPEYRDGALLDGFPRTGVQVECLKLLVDQIDQLNHEFANTDLAIYFRRPTIHAMVLFASEQTSVERQLYRGRQLQEHNRKVDETGVGEIRELRATDLDPIKAAQRYRVFKEHTWDALQSLKEIYHYHFINAEGPIEEVEANILKELQYQSSLELDPRTFDRLRSIPLAEEIIVHARQELVKRLDSYELNHRELFVRVVDIVQSKFMPIIERHALSGRALVNTTEEIFGDSLALTMLIDIFSERGFHAVVDKRRQDMPKTVDLKTGEIECKEKVFYRITIFFEGSSIRRG